MCLPSLKTLHDPSSTGGDDDTSRAEVSDFSHFSPQDTVRTLFIVHGGKKFKFENKVIVAYCFVKINAPDTPPIYFSF
jgi:hypothetical protein